MTAGHPDAFPLTRHSVVRAIARADPEVRAQAYDAIVRSYWRPVYAYIRVRWRRDAADAQDLTQDFFTRALGVLGAVRRVKGAFPHVRPNVPRSVSFKGVRSGAPAWTRGLFADAVERLRAECTAAGRPQAFEAFVSRRRSDAAAGASCFAAATASSRGQSPSR